MTSDNEKTRDEAESAADEESSEAVEETVGQAEAEASGDPSTAEDGTNGETGETGENDENVETGENGENGENGEPDMAVDEPEEVDTPHDPTDLMNADALILSEDLGKVGTFDRWIYNLEVVIVVTALVVMSITVFTDVIFQLVVSVEQDLGKGDPAALTTIGGILAFIGLMAFAATGDNSVWDPDAEEHEPRTEPQPLGVRLGVVAATIAASVAVGWGLLTVESTTVYRLILVGIMAPVIWMQWSRSETRAVAILGISTLLAIYLFGSLPEGYSWAQSYSLLLLLWVGFLGASIAARERRHLRVDLARKLLPGDKVPAFNAISYLVAAAFTGVVLYLGYIYIFGSDSTYLRPIWDAPAWLPESTRQMLMTDFPLSEDASFWRKFLQVVFAPSEPGEVPDWLKVLAIPVSMLLICLRFLGHAFVFARMAVRGESFSEATGVH